MTLDASRVAESELSFTLDPRGTAARTAGIPLAETRVEDLLHRAVAAGLSAEVCHQVQHLAEQGSADVRGLTLLLLCERLVVGEGSVFLSLSREALLQPLSALGFSAEDAGDLAVELSAIPDQERWLITSMERLLETGPCPFVFDRESASLYRHKLWAAEQRAAALTLDKLRKAPEPAPNLETALRNVFDEKPLMVGPLEAPRPMIADKRQREAVARTLAQKFTVISGGPGSGKTTLVVMLLRVLVRLGVDPAFIRLCAPTGKAANRLGEALRQGLARAVSDEADRRLLEALPEPATLHRLLAWSPSREVFGKNRENPLDAAWLIIDEGSMMDVTATAAVFDALREETRLLILGDADQLPSVEAGAVFRDLSRGRGSEAFAISLQGAHRQAGAVGGAQILKAADFVNRGDVSGFWNDAEPVSWSGGAFPEGGLCWIDAARFQFEGFVHLAAKHFWQSYYQLASRTYDENDLEGLGRLFDAFQAVKWLAPLKHARVGVDGLNEMLKMRLPEHRRLYYPGAALMMTRNDYRRRLFNGDVGLIVRFRGQGLRLVFPYEHGYRFFAVAGLSGLEPAFAITVHKSQGSEAPAVCLVLPNKANHLCRREILYTALTRAKRLVLVYGEREVLNHALETGMSRNSGLAERIRRGFSQDPTP